MKDISMIDEALKLGAIVALALWAAHKGYKKGREERKYEYNKGYEKGFEDGVKEKWI